MHHGMIWYEERKSMRALVYYPFSCEIPVTSLYTSSDRLMPTHAMQRNVTYARDSHI
jgi:hypothetical protein